MPDMGPAFDMLSWMPLAARTVLDVGCGDDGRLAAYRQMNPRARLLGIAPNARTAEVAAQHMDEIIQADIEADSLPFELPDGIDCIIYDDVLQTQEQPWQLIRRHAALLRPDGIILIRVPNIDYWRLTDQRLRGASRNGTPDWQYRRHAWRLTIDGIKESLSLAGLTVCDVMTQEPDGEAASLFCEALLPALQQLGIDPADYARRASASHLICRASKLPVQRMTVSGNMLAPVGGVSDVRVVHPLQAMGSDPAVITTVTDRVEPGPPNDTDPRIFVLHRPSLIGSSGDETLRKLTGAGYLIVTEFDDHPDHFQMMRNGGDLSFLGVHAVQTSTPTMAEVLRKYNPDVAVFPNALVQLPEIRNFADPHHVTLFFGALNRERDWQTLMPAINAVAETAGDRLRFQIVHDRMFFEALETPHKTFTPTCDYETYCRILGGCEISLMPLADTAFNRAKSDLKFIEAGACRVAALASSVVYGDSIDDGRTGLLFRDPTELHTRLLRLIAMPDLALALGDAARDYVSEHRMLAYQVEARIRWYRSLWIRRHGLEEARQTRMRRRKAA